MRLQHNPRRALTVSDDALVALAARGCPNCHAPVHPEALVVAVLPKVTTVSCASCEGASAALVPPIRSP